MLHIVKAHIKTLGMKVAEINGQVQVKLRGDIVEDFNKSGRGAQVMLLSLAAGGVGLNLVIICCSFTHYLNQLDNE